VPLGIGRGHYVNFVIINILTFKVKLYGIILITNCSMKYFVKKTGLRPMNYYPVPL